MARNRNRTDSAEIRRRIKDEIDNAKLIRRLAKPRGETLHGAVPMLELIQAELAGQINRLKEIRAAL